jgi:hypothetical protein
VEIKLTLSKADARDLYGFCLEYKTAPLKAIAMQLEPMIGAWAVEDKASMTLHKMHPDNRGVPFNRDARAGGK